MAKANVAALRQHLEQLFPGKWFTSQTRDKLLKTGIGDIDNGIIRGFPRRSITEWSGSDSSGKLTLLRSAIAHWCLSGLNVAYVDTLSRLVAADWAFVEQGICGAKPTNLAVKQSHSQGQFIAVRIAREAADFQKSNDTLRKLRREASWATEQLIRSALFDVVVLDLGESFFINDRTYARLHRALDKSRVALILVKERGNKLSSSWASSTKAHFGWSETFDTKKGIDEKNSVMIIPAVDASLSRDGLTQSVEIGFDTNVSNSLYTYSQIPDRRTSKTRPRTKG